MGQVHRVPAGASEMHEFKSKRAADRGCMRGRGECVTPGTTWTRWGRDEEWGGQGVRASVVGELGGRGGSEGQCFF